MIKFGGLTTSTGILFSLLLTGCSPQIGSIEMPNDLHKIIAGRQLLEQTVLLFKNQYCSTEPIDKDCKEGVYLYSITAGQVNGILSNTIIAIESNSKLKISEKQIQDVTDNLQSLIKILESKKESGLNASSMISVSPINIGAILSSLIGFVQDAKNHDARQRAALACQISQLYLPPYASIEKTTISKLGNECSAHLIPK